MQTLEVVAQYPLLCTILDCIYLYFINNWQAIELMHSVTKVSYMVFMQTSSHTSMGAMVGQ